MIVCEYRCCCTSQFVHHREGVSLWLSPWGSCSLPHIVGRWLGLILVGVSFVQLHLCSDVFHPRVNLQQLLVKDIVNGLKDLLTGEQISLTLTQEASGVVAAMAAGSPGDVTVRVVERAS